MPVPLQWTNKTTAMSDLSLKVERVHHKATLPTKHHKGDAGFDLTAISTNRSNNYPNLYKCRTGIAVEIPEEHVGIIHPRSSIYKRNLMLANTTGVIDSGYRGEIMCFFRCLPGSHNMYEPGDRIAQLIIQPISNPEIIEVERLEDSHRGSGGFGSTGN